MLMKKFIFSFVLLSCLVPAVQANGEWSDAQDASQDNAGVATFDDLYLDRIAHGEIGVDGFEPPTLCL